MSLRAPKWMLLGVILKVILSYFWSEIECYSQAVQHAFLLAGARYARLRAEWALRSSRVASARALERTSARFLRRKALSNSSSAASGACSGDFSELKMARPGSPACLFGPN